MINYFKKLPADEYSLRIIGHCPRPDNMTKIEDDCRPLANCFLQLEHEPIPYHKILAQISENTIGLLPYKRNKSTENKVPTKLFEYLALGLPVLVSKNTIWNTMIMKYQGGASIDFCEPPNYNDLGLCVNLINRTHNIDYKELMWISEETKFLNTINLVIKN